jgi:uncharacterized membrane protein YczE
MTWKLILIVLAAIGLSFVPAFASKPEATRFAIIGVIIGVVLIASAAINRAQRNSQPARRTAWQPTRDRSGR